MFKEKKDACIEELRKELEELRKELDKALEENEQLEYRVWQIECMDWGR
jgi:regulator of replication initiation timing